MKEEERAVQCLEEEERFGMEEKMDTFIGKLAQKRNAQEMIRANTTAEAIKMEQMQNQMEQYDKVMQEIRRVNLKTAENAVTAQDLLKECIEKTEALQQEGKTQEDREESAAELKKMLEELFRQSDDFLHKENVKVYRNVQAALVEELNKQTEAIKAEQNRKKSGKGPVVLMVLILIGVAADLAIHIFTFLTMMGIL